MQRACGSVMRALPSPGSAAGTAPICLHEREQWCLTPKFLGARVPGGYSDHVIVPHPMYLVPYDGIPTELACTYACAGLTAYSAIQKTAPLREDDYLVHDRRRRRGLERRRDRALVVPAKLIVADIDPEKRAVARQAGAWETIDNGAPDAAKKVLELTKGGVKAAIDFVGAPQTARFGMDVLRKGGTLVVVGLFGGALSVPLPLAAPALADAARLLRRHARGAAGGDRARPGGQGAADPARRPPARRRAAGARRPARRSRARPGDPAAVSGTAVLYLLSSERDDGDGSVAGA